MTGRVWDAGLQPERTALAWRRLAVSLVGLGFAVPRLEWAQQGGLSLLAGGAFLVLGVIVLIGSHRRYRLVHGSLMRESNDHPPDGRLPAFAAIACTLLAVGGLVTVLT